MSDNRRYLRKGDVFKELGQITGSDRCYEVRKGNREETLSRNKIIW